MKTSTFLTISTSVLLGALDVSSALTPPTRDQLLRASSRPSTGDSEPEIYDSIPIPDIESPDISDPPPIPHPQIPTKGYYELPNGTLIAVEVREPGYGQNPKPVEDYDYVSGNDNPLPVRRLLPPPPLPGSVVYGDGVKHFPITENPELEHLVESESALLVSDVTGREPPQKIANRDLGDFKDLADDFLADLKGKYETLKSDVDDFKFPDFDDLRKYLPSEIDVDVDFDGTTIEEPPFPPHKDIDASKLSDDLIPFTDVNFGITTFVEPIPDGEVIVEPIPEGREIVEPIPEGREIVEPIPPRFRTLPPPPGYHYHITVSASSPAPTTFATVTRSSGSARPSGYVYKGI